MSTTVESLMRAQQQHLVDQVMDNERVARSFGLGLTELQVLHLMVLRADARTLRALVGLTGLPSSTVADAVDRLVRAGFAARVRDEGDRRVVNLAPTERVALVAAAYADSAMAARGRQVVEEMGEAELRVVLTYFERLNQIRATED
jgi:DNA-binding MarR family transcriptional regulator